MSDNTVLYKIKPLEWKGQLNNDFDEVRAEVSFGYYSITKRYLSSSEVPAGH